MSTAITRRTLLASAVALPWLAACSTGPDTTAGVDLSEGTFSSRFWPGHEVRWRLARPAASGAVAPAQPVVVALHGHGGDFYWHARRSGIDPGALVVRELLPLLAGKKGLATDRIGLIGWSMGGYCALLLASRLGPRRVSGVVATSAALWQSPGDSAPGAFDDRQDFVRNDVFSARPVLARLPVRLDCGSEDPFIAANRAFARGLPTATATFDPGAHTETYWTAQASAQMTWLSRTFTKPAALLP